MSRREWLAAAVIAVLALAASVYLLRDDTEDPEPRADTDPPSGRVMSVAAGEELIDRLSERGWACYDSLPDPIVKRCFLDEIVGDGGTVRADVALTYGEGYITRANVYVEGERDNGWHVGVAESAARVVGDVLLDGAGAELADRLGASRETEIAGRVVFGSRAPGSSVQVIVQSASYDDRGMPPPDFPARDALVRAAERGGLACREDGSSTACGSTGAGPTSMTVTMSETSGRIGSLSISASNVASPEDPVVTNMVAGYLFETGLGGPPASRWVQAHAGSATPVRADLGGLYFRLGGGGDRAVYLSVGEITN